MKLCVSGETKCPKRKKQMKFWLHINRLHNSYALDYTSHFGLEFSSVQRANNAIICVCACIFGWLFSLTFDRISNWKKKNMIDVRLSWNFAEKITTPFDFGVIDFLTDDVNALQRWWCMMISFFLFCTLFYRQQQQPTFKYENTRRTCYWIFFTENRAEKLWLFPSEVLLDDQL